MQVAVDGTPAATQFAGVGRYTRELIKALLQLDFQDRYTIFCTSDRQQSADLESSLPPGAWREIKHVPIPGRLTTAAWQRLRLPLPVETLIGSFDVFHGPDFVLPPTRYPSVVTVHDLSYLIAPELGDRSLVRYLTDAVPRSLERASQVIAVSASVAREIVDAYPLTRHKVRAIPNGVAPCPTEYKRRPSNKQPSILIVGTIEPRKNHLSLLDAMPYVWQSLPDTRLIIAGRVGWRADHIVSRIASDVSSRNVVFVESPSDEVLNGLFERATAFVYPSLYEGFGLPVLEAMARDVPVIASNIPVLRETAGDAACYVEADNPESIADAICTVLGDEQVRNRLTEAGRSRVSMHSWSETAVRTRKAYVAAVEGN